MTVSGSLGSNEETDGETDKVSTVIVVVLVFAGIITYQALSRPIEVTIIQNTTAAKPNIPPPG